MVSQIKNFVGGFDKILISWEKISQIGSII